MFGSCGISHVRQWPWGGGGEGNLVPVFRQPLDVVRKQDFLGRPLGSFHDVEQMVDRNSGEKS